MGKGNIIGKPNDPTTSVASGVWSLRENFLAVKNNRWPAVFSWGPAYGGWNGQRILFSTISDDSGSTSYNGLDGTLDSATQRLYDGYMGGGTPGYRTGGFYGWTTNTSLPAPASSDGRSSTIAYVNGVGYLYIGNVDRTVDIYLLSNLSFVTTWNLTLHLANQCSGLAWDGTGILFTELNGNFVKKIANANPGITPSVSTIVNTLVTPTGFGLKYNATSAFYRGDNSASAYEVSLSTGALLQSFSAANAGYGIALDYANKKLYLGGFLNTTMRRFSGT